MSPKSFIFFQNYRKYKNHKAHKTRRKIYLNYHDRQREGQIQKNSDQVSFVGVELWWGAFYNILKGKFSEYSLLLALYSHETDLILKIYASKKRYFMVSLKIDGRKNLARACTFKINSKMDPPSLKSGRKEESYLILKLFWYTNIL